MADPNPAQTPPDLAPEDAARRDCYALLARLLYASPDRALLDALVSVAPESTAGELAMAFAALVDAARGIGPDAEMQRYNDTFIGTGKAPVTPYLSHYLAETGREKILVRLRDDLAGLGLARKVAAVEPEDHIAGICELMRHLVGQGSGEASLARQREIFDRYLARSFIPFCDAVMANPNRGDFIEAVARYAKAFLAVEAEGFAMLP